MRIRLVVTLAAIFAGASPADTISVRAGGNFQEALQQSQPGDVIQLEAGEQTRRIVIRNNLFYDLGSKKWGGNGRLAGSSNCWMERQTWTRWKRRRRESLRGQH